MIKLLACIFMLVDHIGIIFFPKIHFFRVLGRLSMPFYAYCIARGIKYTKDTNKYIKRVLEVAIIAQIPFCMMEGELKLNICFLWVIGIYYISTFNKLQERYKKILLSTIVIFIISILNIDYKVYGFLYLLIMYFVLFDDKKNSDLYMYSSWGILHLTKILFDFYSGIIQIFTLPTIPIIDMCNKYGLEKKRKNNILIQFFYPIHMIILLFIYKVLNICLN